MLSDSPRQGPQLFPLSEFFDEAVARVPDDPALQAEAELKVREELLARAAPEYREAVRMFIEQGEIVGTAWAYPGDREMARLLAEFYALQDARQRALAVDNHVLLARRGTAEVTVALVDAFARADIVARITRDPGAQGRNIVYVARDGLSAAHIAAGLDAVSRSRQVDGDYLVARRVVLVKGVPVPGRVSPLLPLAEAAYGTLLTGVEFEDLPGRRAVPVAKVTLPPEKGER